MHVAGRDAELLGELVDGVHQLLRKLELEGLQALLHLLDGGGADDDGGVAVPVYGPGERQLGRGDAVLLGELRVLGRRQHRNWHAVAGLEAGLRAHTPLCRRSVRVGLFLPLASRNVLSGQHTAREIAIGQAHDAEAVGGLIGVLFVGPVEHREVVLARDGARHAEFVRRDTEHGDAVGVLVGQAPMLDEALVEKVLDRENLRLECVIPWISGLQLSSDGHATVRVLSRVEGGAAEQGHVARWPVQLV
mmetsp:Transcript_16318/g.53141  ORF Transcript_16318/g.53141 Transcript_16318/m.53141 type:complete len:248 (-) Transcript_16318:1695-2438(-)